MIRRLALPIAAVTLGVLLALLAFLQYRWLGQVSEGERQRMKATLEARARDFAAEFDRELSKAASAFSVPASDLAGDPAGALAVRWNRWLASASDAKLVRAVFVVDRSTPQLALRRFDAASRTLLPAEWPEPFRGARERWAAEFRGPSASPAPGSQQLPHVQARVFVEDLADVPALVVPNPPEILNLETGGAPRAPRPTDSPATTVTEQAISVRATETAMASARLLLQQPRSNSVLLWLDLDEIRRSLLPGLVRRYFSADDVFDYQVTVLLRRDAKTVLFETDHPRAAPGDAVVRHVQGDAVIPMFRLRLTDVFTARIPEPGAGPSTAHAASAKTGDNVSARSDASAGAGLRLGLPDGQGAQAGTSRGGPYSVSVMRFEAVHQPPARTGAVIAVSDASGGWLLRLVHRAGSLDAAVERLRRRNLAISSTILGLLAVSLGFVLVSTRRAQRLAALQVEFVASVSHELRTPLTVIRSAGENLADGVVDTPDQVRRYGALVAEEGRKLGSMVEQVMEYAGMQSDQPRWRKEPVDLRTVVTDAVAAARRLPEGRQAAIDVEIDEVELPAIDADRAALVRAVQNLVENALKYGTAPGAPAWVGVRVSADRESSTRTRPLIAIEVTDRGPGIDGAERRRIFEPFVRGRAAAAGRVPGNGLGLSIVKRVADAHGGSVDARNLQDGGARFCITLRN